MRGHEAIRRRILIDRLGADHELRNAKAARACKTDEEHHARLLTGERAGRRGGRLDGSDPARERRDSTRTGKLPLGGRNDEDHAGNLAGSLQRVNARKHLAVPASQL